jgi:pseudouridine kinase
MPVEEKTMEKMDNIYIAGVGAANADVHGRSRNAVVMRDSNPGRMRISSGGVTRNIIENLARQGVPTKLLTAVGGDVFGEMIMRDTSAAGTDLSDALTIDGEPSSCYIAALDESGEMLIGLSDMSILRYVTEDYLSGKRALLRAAAAVVCDPCLPVPSLRYVIEEAARGVPVFLDPVSTAYARAAAPLIGGVFCVKPNRMELAVLAGTDTDTDDGIKRAAEILLGRGTKRVAVSLGARGCYYADDSGVRMFRTLRPLTEMDDATGAGDAFMSGLVHGFVAGYGAEETLDYALAAGILAIQSDLTINPLMSDAAVRRTMEEFRA